MAERPSATRITVAEMRERFNRGKYWERMRRGEFTPVVIEQGNLEPGVAVKEPFRTVSQMISYRDAGGNEVARVHQYLRPDGTVAGSGLPDPKRLFEDGTIYRLMRKKK